MARDSDPPRYPPPPEPPIDRSHEKSGAGVAAAIAAVCLVCAPLTARFEGKRNAPYRDAAGIPTVCYGETQVAMRVYSDDECGRMLRAALAKRYAPKILACWPELARPERRNAAVAMLDSSYNAGPAAICSSPMHALARAGDWPAACARLRSFHVGAITDRPIRGARSVRRITQGPNKGRYFNTLGGLVDRRAFFAAFCMKPAPPPVAPPPPTRADYPVCVTVKPGPLLRRRKPVFYPNLSEIS